VEPRRSKGGVQPAVPIAPRRFRSWAERLLFGVGVLFGPVVAGASGGRRISLLVGRCDQSGGFCGLIRWCRRRCPVVGLSGPRLRFSGCHRRTTPTEDRFIGPRPPFSRRGLYLRGECCAFVAIRSTPVVGGRPLARSVRPPVGGSLGGARGLQRVGRSSTRPVLKHGPRSLTCARVRGTLRGPRAE
jgi:hypothetical protein